MHHEISSIFSCAGRLVSVATGTANSWPAPKNFLDFILRDPMGSDVVNVPVVPQEGNDSHGESLS